MSRWDNGGPSAAIRKNLSRVGLAAGVAALAPGALPASAASAAMAATIDVPCSTSALVQAVMTANAAKGPTVINLAAGCTYPMTGSTVFEDNFGTDALPTVTNPAPITINGNGAVLNREGGINFRFLATAPGTHLTVNNLTLENGNDVSGIGGGAILNRGTLTLNHVVLSANTDNPSSGTSSGGAIVNGGLLTINSSDIERDRAINSNGDALGGAILNGGPVAGGATAELIMRNTLVKNDSAITTTGIAEGGGIANEPGAIANIEQSTIKNNKAMGKPGNGGGIFNAGILALVQSKVTGNVASDEGGGLYATPGSTTSALQSRIFANTPDDCSPAIRGVCND